MDTRRLLTIIFCLSLLAGTRIFAQTTASGTPSAATGGFSASAQQQPPGTRTILLAEAVDLALKQASNYRAAQFTERIAAEDVRQAKAAFYPKVAAVPTVIYTTPSLASTLGNIPRPPSFLGANAITEYQALANTSGEFDTSGKLRAGLRRSEFLLASARAGTEIARRELIAAVGDAYFVLALTATKRAGAGKNLANAEEFENNIRLQLGAGEVAPVDLVRARLQTAARRDELAAAQSDESTAADTLLFLTGGKSGEAIATVDLLTMTPVDNEIDNFAETAIRTRPEFAQFDAFAAAARQDVRSAIADRRPQVTYSVNTGFISDSLSGSSIKNRFGAQISVGVRFTLFDKGISRSQETQARLRIEQTGNARQLAERMFVTEFYTARRQAAVAATRIRSIAGAITDAEQNVIASTARYRAGEASIIEVTDAQNTLIALRQSLYQAIYDYQTAKLRVMRAAGQ